MLGQHAPDWRRGWRLNVTCKWLEVATDALGGAAPNPAYMDGALELMSIRVNARFWLQHAQTAFTIGSFDLLITDVGLPGGLNGRQLADAGREKRPDLKVLFITGYAESAMFDNGQVSKNMSILTKPFAVDALTTRIRELIVD